MSLSAPDLTSTGAPRLPRSSRFLGTAIIALMAYYVQLLVALAAHVAEIVALDLLFGYLRYRSGSTLLTALLSSAVNVASTIEIALIVAYS